MSYFSLRFHYVELELKIIIWNIVHIFVFWLQFKQKKKQLNINVPFFFLPQHLAFGVFK